MTDEDYRLLWMVASPPQIIEEFSEERTRSTRTIYRIYEKYRISGIKEHRKRLKAQLQRSRPGWSDAFINHELQKQEAVQREKAFEELWEKIEDYEGTFNAYREVD